MRRAAPTALLVTAVLVVSAPGPRAQRAAPPRPIASHASIAAFLAGNCASCHNDRARTAGLTLSALDAANVGQHADIWEKILHKLRTGQMPPAGRPRPESAALQATMVALAEALDRAASRRSDLPATGAHRLNRTEYANAIRDLLGLEIDARTMLLPDEADEGFDNVAASLALSPAHLERYLATARDISRLAVGDETLADVPATSTYRVPKLLEQDVRISDDAPFGSRGGVVVRHTFPRDGEYAFKVRLRRQVYDYIIGMGHPQTLDLRIDGNRVKRFTVGGEGRGTPGPLTWNGEIVGETSWELYMHAADAGLELRTHVSAGPHVIGVTFVDSPWEAEGVTQPLPVDFGRGSDEQYDGYAAVDALTIHGPYSAGHAGDTPSRRRIFTCRPQQSSEEAVCARTILSALARRAYRRPVTTADLDTLMAFYDEGRRDRGFEAGIQAALERMLVSFHFLFRIQGERQFDLASRLSFLLWSSIPDDTLLGLAERGRLADPAVLTAQARRMLRDEKARAVIDNFAGQWLGLRKAATALPDPNVFPEFDENLRRAFLEETARFVDDQLRADRSVIDLVGADYSFLNERLADHYGVANVSGDRFRKVTFSDGARGGLLGQGALLMLTSYPDRTAPVLRGVWILDTLLGMPPPPPPPNIPDLETTDADGKPRSIREQMEVHRRNPACAVCHVRMDPLGFAMENFDAIGRWRTRAANAPVDASAVFADGTPLDGIRGVREFVLSHRGNYVHTVVEKLMTYALGRHVDYRDQPAIRKIVRDSGPEHRWSQILLGIVASQPFRGSTMNTKGTKDTMATKERKSSK
jgi:mono/diheme cytochrome c family protein